MNQASTGTSISSSSSPNPAVAGQPVTFTATVSPLAPGSGTPTGMVTFTDGATTLGTFSLNGSRQATLTVPSLAPGSHSIAGQYNGDPNFQSSSSAGSGGDGGFTQTVNPAATSTTVTSSVNPLLLNQTVTFTANVSVVAPGSGTPTGSVTFKDGANALATVLLSASRTATFSTSSLAVGSHAITATYNGDTNFSPSTGSLGQNVAYGVCALYDQTRSVQSGAVYPIKVALCDVNGTDVSSSTVVLHATAVTKVSVFVGTPESPGNTNPDNDFRFDSTLGTTGGYIFNLSTSGLASGTYSQQFTAAGDPVTHSVNFGVK